VNWTQSLSPAWAMNAKASYNRINLARSLGARFATPRLFMGNFSQANIGGFLTALPGDLPFDPTLNSQFTGPINLFQGSLDFSGPWRNQQFRLGAAYFYTQDNRRVGSFQNGQFIFGPSLPQALNNLLLGQVSTFQVAVNPQGALPGQTVALPLAQPDFSRSLSSHDFSLYFSHNWRAHPRLNVVWGLRYDFYDTPRARNGQVLFNFIPGAGTDIFTQVRNGQLQSAGSLSEGSLYKRDWDNIAPRIGLAWDVTGDGRTSLRAGYGITYVSTFNTVAGYYQSTPNFAIVSLTANTGTTGVIPLSTANFGPLAGTTGTVTLPGTLVRGIERNIDTPFVHFWNVSLERELARNTVAAVRYTGSAGRDLLTVYNVNRPGSAAAFVGDPNPTARLNPQFGPIYFLRSDGRSNYNALLVELSNSTWQTIGLQFSARYRYAKANDNVPASLGSSFGNFGGSFAPGLVSPFNPDFDYGPADYDLRHRFIGSFDWEVPFEKIGDRFFGGSGSAIARQVFGGWQLTGIISANHGAPFTVFNCAGAATAETPCPRLVLTGEIDREGLEGSRPDPSVPNRFVFIDPAQTTGGVITPGNVFGPFPAGATGRNFFRGPGFWNVDLGVGKRFRFTENSSVRFRGEFFNAFNHPNLFVPASVDVGSSSYVPAFKSGRRQIQLAMKFVF